ncbi:NAD/FAD-utilizing enzyme [Paraglaciecola sp. 20A4]|uniref:NAD/FAD-utilizing enzyme n=1 Tax=Paraglaciecola sp. 20A4 TaxID=2687288 RepID=UPI001409D127|nr:NAD/FAD-utilizing enzyme [Paraglaciecola sp. 20A4]
MFRHYYITEDLKDLKQVEQELLNCGLTVPQFHVLSENDTELEKHHLHAIEAVLKKDVVHSTQLGAVIGVIGAVLILLVAYFFSWHTTAVGWIPFGFCAVVMLGFCTWEGGLIGIQTPNYQFKQFQHLLSQGMHIFFVDITPEQHSVLREVSRNHPSLRYAGSGEATPSWIVNGQTKFSQVMKTMP